MPIARSDISLTPSKMQSKPQFSIALFTSLSSSPENMGTFSERIEAVWLQEAMLNHEGIPANLQIDCINIDFEAYMDEAWLYLSAAEKKRAYGFVNKQNMTTYVLAHAALRLLLSKRLNIRPEEIRFLVGNHGKPLLESTAIPLHFNISYRKNAFVIAIGEIPVGVDLEILFEDIDVFGVAERMFTVNELSMLQKAASKAETYKLFFEIWTRKEAVIKLFGRGVDDMPDFSVHESCGTAINAAWAKNRCCYYSLPILDKHAIAIAF